jgi:hypothetical protein
MMGVGLFGLLLVLAVVAALVFLSTRAAPDRSLTRHERAELARLRELVEDLKETAWDHRELDSALSTILIDKIRASERRGRELGP